MDALIGVVLLDKTDVLEALKHSNVFLTGGAGVGKSYITNEIIEVYKKRQKQVIPLGSTGVSAVNIGGVTVHSFFVLGIASTFDELKENDKRSRNRLVELRKILRATELIIIDEISMISSNLMEMIAYRIHNAGYLGKIMFVGDFFQLPPIVRRQDKEKHTDIFGEKLYAFESIAWHRFELFVIELKEMKRTTDREFTHILAKVRQGICDDEVIHYMKKLTTHTLEEENKTYLYGRNLEVENNNRLNLNQLDSEETILFSDTTIFGNINEKKLNSWKNMLPILDNLTLKEGVPILFTINKWGKFFNGERGILKRIEENYLIIEKDEEYIKVEKHDFDLADMKVKEDGTVEMTTLATVSQFPLKLAYAITIHKSQGMSINSLVCNVDNIFSPSQFYVAISRAMNPNYLKLEFTKGDLTYYLRRVINVDNRVVEYYKSIS